MRPVRAPNVVPERKATPLALPAAVGVVLLAALIIAAGQAQAAITSPSVASATANTLGNTVITFTPAAGWPVTGRLQVTFPAGYDVSAATMGTVTGCDGGFTRGIAGQIVTVTRNGAGHVSGVSGCTGAITITLGNVRTPGAGPYSIGLQTQDGTGAPIDTANPVQTITAGALAGSCTALPCTTVANSATGASTSYTFAGTATNGWPNNGKFIVTFPAGFDASGAASSSTSCGGVTFTALPPAVPPAAQVVTVTRSDGSNCASGAPISITLAGIINRNTIGTTGAIAFKTATSTGATIDNGSGTVTLTAATLTLPTDAVTATPSTSGAVAGYTFKFTTHNTFPGNAKFIFNFPPAYDLGSVGVPTLTSTPCAPALGAPTRSFTGTTLTVQLPSAASSCPPGAWVIDFTGIKTQPFASSASIPVCIQTSAGASPCPPGTAAGTIEVGTPIAGIIPASLTAVTMTPGAGSPTPVTPGSASSVTYQFQFTLANDWPNNGKFIVHFPAGYDLSAMTSSTTFSVTGCAGPFAIAAPVGQDVTITRSNTGTGVTCPAGTAMSVSIGGIRNPGISGSVIVSFNTATSTAAAIDSDSKSVTISDGLLTGTTVVPASPPATASALTSYIFTFTTAGSWPSTGHIVITFPTGTNLTAVSSATLADGPGATCTPGSLLIAARTGAVLDLVRTGGTPCGAASTMIVTVNGARNPPTSGPLGFIWRTTDAFLTDIDATPALNPTPGRTVGNAGTTLTTTLTAGTPQFSAADIGQSVSGPNIPAGTTITGFTSTTSVTMSQAATLAQASVAVGIGTVCPQVGPQWVCLNPGVMAAPGISESNTAVGGATSFTATFTTVSPLPKDGKVAVRFPAGYPAFGGSSVTGKTGCTTGTFSASATAGPTVVTITRSGTGSDCPAGTLSFTFSGVVNPGVSGVQNFALNSLQTQTATGMVIDQGPSAATLPLTVTPAALTSVSFAAPTSTQASHLTNYKIDFKLANGWSTTDLVTLNFPAGYDASGAAFVTATPACASPLSAPSRIATSVTFRTDGVGCAPLTPVEIYLNNIRNPPYSGSSGTITVCTQRVGTVGTCAAAGTVDAGTGSVTLTAGDLGLSGVANNVVALPPSAGSIASYTFTFDAVDLWPYDGQARVTFPAGYDLSGIGGFAGTAGAACNGGTLAVTRLAQVVTITRGGPGATDCGPGTTDIEITLSGIRNPTTPGAQGFTWSTALSNGQIIDATPALPATTITCLPRTVADGVTAAASTSVTSVANAFLASDVGRPVTGAGVAAGTRIVAFVNPGQVTIAPAATGLSAGGVTLAMPSQYACITTNTLTGVTITPGSTVDGARTNYVIAFTPSNPWPNDGKLQITFPTGYDASGVTGATGPCAGSGFTMTLPAAPPAAQTLTLTRAGTSPCPAGVATTVTLTGVRNAGVSGPQVFALDSISTLTSGGLAIDQGPHAPATPVTVTLTPATLTAVSLTPGSYAAATATTYQFRFTTVNAWGAADKLVVTFPAGYTIAAPTASITTGAGCTAGTLTGTFAANVITLTRAAPATLCPALTTVTVTISAGITNPVGAASSFIAFQTQSGANAIDTGGVSVSTGPVTSAVVAPLDATPGQTTSYSFLVSSGTTWPTTGDFKVFFPTGFAVGTPTSATLAGCDGGFVTPLPAPVVATPPYSSSLTLTRIGGTPCAPGAIVITIGGIANPATRGRYSPFELQLLTSGSAAVLEDHAGSTFIQLPASQLVSPGVCLAGVAANRILTLQVQVWDTQHNGVAGATLAWAKTGNGTLLQSSSTTDDSGFAIVQFQLDAKASPAAVTATLPGVLGSPLRFSINAPGTSASCTMVIDSLAITPSAHDISADAGLVTLAATAKDAAHASLGDVTATTVFTVTPDGSCVAAKCTITKVGAHTITGNNLGIIATTLVNVTAGAPKNLALVPATQANIAAGSAQTMQVKLLDAHGNPIEGTTVAWAVGTGAGSVSPASSLTDKAGLASATLTTGATPGVNTATATVPGAVGSPLTVTVNTATPTTIVPVTATIGNLAAGNSQTIQAIVKDASGAPIIGVQVMWAATGSATVTPPQSATDSTGTAVATVTGTGLGNTVVHASVVAVAAPADFAVTVVPGTLAKITVSPAGASVAAGAAQTYTVTGADALGNSLGDATSGAIFSISPDGSCTGAICTPAQPGLHTISVVRNGITTSTTMTATGTTTSSSTSAKGSPGFELAGLVVVVAAIAMVLRRRK